MGGLLEIDFEGHWIRVEHGWLGQVRLFIDLKKVASTLSWFGSADMPRLRGELPDGTEVEVYYKGDMNSGRSRLAIAVGGRTIART